MITENLFDTMLVQPVNQGANTLYVISGYATAAMAFHHLQFLKSQNHRIKVNLIVGMCSIEGLPQSNHKAFQELMQASHPNFFECSYLTAPPPVHSKVYAWFKDNDPVCGFTGSANYTQRAFSRTQREAATISDPQEGLEYYRSLTPQTIYCNHPDAENLVQIFNDNYYARLHREQPATQQRVVTPAETDFLGLPSVQVNLLDRSGNLPPRSGLNWGQRPELRREANQAYIHLPSSVYNSEFFPARTVHFTILTDDDKVLICTRAQDNGKAIHTPHNNSLIGEYFRNRIGVPNGTPITKNDLLRYGRTDIVFYKIDDETYYMDFSAPSNG